MKLIKSEECREVYHGTLSVSQKRIDQLEEDISHNNDKVMEKLDKIVEAQTAIKVEAARSSAAVKAHMDDEEKTMGIVFWVLGILGTLITGALWFLFAQGNGMFESVIRSEEHVQSILKANIKYEERISDIEVYINKQ